MLEPKDTDYRSINNETCKNKKYFMIVGTFTLVMVGLFATLSGGNNTIEPVHTDKFLGD